MKKVIAFDMDGTIADLYNVPNWLQSLTNEDVSPYLNAKPIINVSTFINLLLKLKSCGYSLAIVSWLAKGSSKDYDKAVRQAKTAWLDKYFPNVFDELHFIKYGSTKRQAIRKYDSAVLVDDNKKIRQGFSGRAIDATDAEKMIEELEKIAA